MLIINDLNKRLIVYNYDDFEKLEDLHEETISELFYLQDMFSLGIPKLTNIIINCIFYYVILPVLCHNIDNDNVYMESQNSSEFSIYQSLVLYLFAFLFDKFTEKKFLEILYSLIFNKNNSLK